MHHEDDRVARVRVAREGARLLHDHRERLEPPPGAADAAWLALGRRIAAGEPSPLADEDEDNDANAGRTPVRRGAPGWRSWAAVAVALAAAVTLWQFAPRLAGRSDGPSGHAASDLRRGDPSDPRSTSPADRGGDTSGHVLKHMLQRTDSDPEVEAPVDVPAAPAPAVPGDSRAPRAPVPKDSPGATQAADLARELALLRRAAEALRAGQAAAALTHAAQYLQEHPAGAFVPEARLHRAEALCLLGREEEARAASAAFLRELPDSPLRARVAAVCAR